MANYIDNGLGALEKSMRDVILPAIDPLDPLAREQAALAIDYIAFVRQRLDYVPLQLRFELQQYRAMARAAVDAAARHPAAAPLEAILQETADDRDDAWTRLDQLRIAVDRLAAGIDEFVGIVAVAAPTLRPAIDRAVLEATQRWIDHELAWYAPIAVDPSEGERPLASFYSDVAGRPAA